jgi:hypothetical protein
MSYRFNWSRWMRIGALLVSLTSLILLSGCIGPMEAIIVPPEVPEMQNVKSVAVLRFNDYTYKGLGMIMTEAAIKSLSPWYSCLDSFYAHGILSSMGLTTDELIMPSEAKKYGDKVGADAIIIGEVIDCVEKVDNRVILVKKHEDGKIDWAVEQVTTVEVIIEGRVIETKTGRMIYKRRATGTWQEVSPSYLIDYKGAYPVPYFYIPAPNQKMVPYARDKAIQDAISTFISPLIPTRQWVRVNK